MRATVDRFDTRVTVLFFAVFFGVVAAAASSYADRLSRDPGPSFSDRLVSSVARRYSQIVWDGQKPYWPLFQATFDPDFLRQAPNRNMAHLESASHGRVLDLFSYYKGFFAPGSLGESFNAATPNTGVPCEYSKKFTVLDALLLQHAYGEGPAIEIMQARAILENGQEILLYEQSGIEREVDVNIRELDARTAAALEKNAPYFSPVVRIDYVHNHPAEPVLFYNMDPAAGYLIPYDLSPQDISVARQLQSLSWALPVRMTALVGLRPNVVTRSSFDPPMPRL